MRLWWRGWGGEWFGVGQKRPLPSFFFDRMSTHSAKFRCRSVAAAGDLLSFASPKESRQRKGEPKSGSLRDALRCSRQAGSRSNSLRCTSLRQSRALIRLPLRCSALPHGVGMGSGAKANTDSEAGIFEVRAQIRHAFSAPFGCFAAKLRSDPKNQAVRRLFKCFRPLGAVNRA